MLTADLVDARRKDGELHLRMLDERGRTEAYALAQAHLETVKSNVGGKRADIDEAWAAIAAESKQPKVAAGIAKLVLDACDFEAEQPIDASEIRRAVFTLASERRRAGTFDRAAILGETAASLTTTAADVERGLFADLRGEHILRGVAPLDAASLVEAWELGQAQAVLLTAVKVTIDVSSASPGLLRAFFSKLKFHRLLFSVERTDKDGFRLVIDGPYSMFDAVTKYGVKLAFVLPALRTLERFSLVADIRWGKLREPLVFKLEGGSGARGSDDALHVSDDVREIAEAINASKSGWRARPTTTLLDVPGHGVCIPDLELKKRGDKKPVYVEVLGFWSRDAVWRRVELAERGLTARVVFAVSSRLRVSAEVLDAELPAALYVYKGKMSARAILERAESLRQR